MLYRSNEKLIGAVVIVIVW